MGTFRLVTASELRTRKKLNAEDIAVFDQFKGYISKLDPEHAGIYEFSPDDDREKAMMMLRRAAKAINLKIRIVRDESSITFYLRRSRKQKIRKSIA